MKIETVEDCFKLRLLRKIKPDINKAKTSLALTKNRIKEAEELFKSKYNFFNLVIIQSYMAMFHAARALLYLDGIQEKSHYATYIYIKEKYRKQIPLHIINLLNIHRIERHESMYGLEYTAEKEDAKIALEDAKQFIKHLKKIIKQKMKNFSNI